MDEVFTIGAKCMLCCNKSEFKESVLDGDYLKIKLGDTIKKVCSKCKTIDALVCIKISKGNFL